MRSSEELEDNFIFILEEIARFSVMSWDEIRPLLKDNAFYEITDASGHKRIMGQAASQLLYDIAEEALAVSDHHGRINAGRAFRAIKALVGERYICPNLNAVDGTQIGRDIGDGIAIAAQDCADRTHFIPCSIGVSEQRGFHIGPVWIRSSSVVLQDLESDFEAYIASNDDSFADRARQSIEIIADYYKSFPDIAEITVIGCDGLSSKSAAQRALQATLDFLHVVAGASYTQRLSAGGPALNQDRRGEIVRRHGGGHLDLSYTVHSSSGANVGDRWWQQLCGDRGRVMILSVGSALTAIVTGEQPKLIAEKFLDACAWYGDAARERSDAAAIVKYLTSMERLLWAGDQQTGVTNRVAERVAALCFSVEAWNMEQIRTEVKQAYKVRSDVVHGRLSAADPLVGKSLRLCERLSRDLILTWLSRYGQSFADDVPLKKLKDYLDIFVQNAKQACASAQSSSAE